MATVVDCPVSGIVGNWTIVITNLSGSTIETATVSRIAMVDPGPDISVTTGFPLAVGGSMTLRGQSEQLALLRLIMTSAGGASVRIEVNAG